MEQQLTRYGTDGLSEISAAKFEIKDRIRVGSNGVAPVIRGTWQFPGMFLADFDLRVGSGGGADALGAVLASLPGCAMVALRR